MILHVNNRAFIGFLVFHVLLLFTLNSSCIADKIYYYELKYEYLGRNTYLMDNSDAKIYDLIRREWGVDLIRMHLQGQKYQQSSGEGFCNSKLNPIEKVFGLDYYAICITNSTSYALIIYTHNGNVYEKLKSSETSYLFGNLGFDYVFIIKTLNDPNKIMDETFDIVNSTGDELIRRIYDVFGKDKIHTLSIGWSWYGGISMDIPDTLSLNDIYIYIP